MKPGDPVQHVKSKLTARVVRVRTLVEVDVDGLHERARRKTYAAENLRPLTDEPTGSSSCAGDPRSPEDGTPAPIRGAGAGVQGWAIITHVFRHYPTDMSTRCGLSVLHAFPVVTDDFAAREDWGGSVRGLAICVGCARR